MTETEQTKVYWRDLDDRSQITNNGSSFTCNGRLIYWHGHEASEAQNWLADEAQVRRKKSQLISDAAEAIETFGEDELERFTAKQTQTTKAGEHVCPNCNQWQNNTKERAEIGLYRDCLNDCAERGFAPKVRTGEIAGERTRELSQTTIHADVHSLLPERPQHTPGPWQVITGSVYTHDEVPIAHMVRNTPRTLPVERDANARLIAAAPELLALVRAWAITDPQGTHADKCRAAIAKAEGSAQ